MEFEVEKQQTKQIKTKDRNDLTVLATEYVYTLKAKDLEGYSVKMNVYSRSPLYEVGEKLDLE